MKSLINSVLVAGLAGFLAFSISACGDSDSGSVTRIENPDDEDLSSSSVKKSSSSSKKVSSSSSEKVSSSSSKKVSSSSEKNETESSSGSKKTSSSSKEVKPKSSSSSGKETSSSSMDFYGGRNPADFNLDSCVTEGFVLSIYDRENDVFKDQVCRSGAWVQIESSSSSEGLYHYGMSNQFNPDVVYSKFKDSRDGNTYKTVSVEGNSDEGEVSFEIFAENLNYGTQVTIDTENFDDSKVEKYCYGDDSWFCENGFGGLYTWSEAMGLPKACDSVRTGSSDKCLKTLMPDGELSINWDTLQYQGICPSGWHIMNMNEWNILSRSSTYVGDMLSDIFGNGNDDGYSLLPTGLLDMAGSDAEYSLIGDWGYLWLPREDIANKAYLIKYSTTRWISSDKVILKTDALAVRCVKNHKQGE